jgi:4-hydroxy-4-methyl-2-oxoglutarate aldolase
MSMDAQVIQALGRFDSPTICNVIELFNARPRNAGALSPAIRAVYPDLPPMVGFAVPFTCRSATAPSPREKPLSLLEQAAAIEAVRAPRVVVLHDLDDPPLGAAYGEVMASTFQACGAVGLVTNGYARDILQVASLKFPCFSTGASVSHAYCRLLSAGEPVNVGGVTIRAGDLLHGDANGVTTIPLDLAAAVAEASEAFVQAENGLIAAAKARPFSLDVLTTKVAEFIRRRDELAARYGRKAAGGDAGL